MTAAAPAASPGLKRVPGVELFASGTRGGTTFTDEDLERIADNGRRYGHLIRPPVKVGHGERQIIARLMAEGLSEQDARSEATGIPKSGTVDWRTLTTARGKCPACFGRGRAGGKPCPNCKGRGWQTVLKGDLADLTPAAADAIDRGEYDGVSAEIYPRPPEGVPGEGPTLRAVAVQGGDSPVVKSLARPLPRSQAQAGRMLRFSECRRLADGCFECFSEVSRMKDRASCYAELKGKIDPQILDEMPDHHVAAVQQMAEGMPDYGDDQQPPDAPQDQAQQYAERAKKFMSYAQKCVKKYAEGSPSPASTMTDPKQVAQANFSELAAEITKAVTASVLAGLAPVKEQIDGVKQQTRREYVRGQLQKFSEEGRVPPAELDAGPDGKGRTLVDDLMDLSDEKVHQFSEGGKTVPASALDLALRRQASRPVVLKKGEATGGGTAPASSPDAEKAKVEQHYEAFSETFQAIKTSKDDFLAGFESARKIDPDTTADRFLNVRPR